MSSHPALGDVGERETVTRIYFSASGDPPPLTVEEGDVLEFTDGWLHLRGESAALSWPAGRIVAVETRPVEEPA